MPQQQYFQYQVKVDPIVFGAAGETVFEDKWHYQWSLPRWGKRPLPTGAYQFLAYSESAQFPESVTESRWHQPWSEPIVKRKMGLREGAQPFQAFEPAPSPFVATGWFEWLSEPKRFKAGVSAAEQQALAFQPMPSPFEASGWFIWLSEPVRQKLGLGAPLQQFFTGDTSVIPLQELIEWFAPFGEPVRFKPDLKPALQQYLAWPPRLLPTPNITGTLVATETPDVFFAGGGVFNAPITADVGVIELAIAALQVLGVLESADSGGLRGVIEQGTSPTPGTPVTGAAMAIVSIREV